MKKRTLLVTAVCLTALGSVFAVVRWTNPGHVPGPGPTKPVRRLPIAVEQVQAAPAIITNHRSPAPSSARPTLRHRFRDAKDYAQLVKEIGPSALDGNVEAQYVTAEALRWCGQTLKLYFIKANGQARTLDEVQARRAAKPGGISEEELATIYARCQGFLNDPELLKSTGSWNQWLDKAASANYPAAMAEKARLLKSSIYLSSLSQLPHDQSAADTEDQAMDLATDLAMRAVQTGDPDAVFLMSDWVRAGNRTAQENATLISAWQILGCQKGYDCAPNSDWMRGLCDWDPQCADGQSYSDYFQRQLGAQYDEALRLAKSIDQAIAAKDVQAIRSYL